MKKPGIKLTASNIIAPICKTTTTVTRDTKNKKIFTSFYFATTTDTFDIDKIKLTEQEKQRQSTCYWVNPIQLEYHLTNQLQKSDNYYVQRYATETLSVLNEFKKVYKKYMPKKEKDIFDR